MSWLGWLLLMAGAYILLVAVRAIVEFFCWLYEEFFPRRRETWYQEEAPPPPPASDKATAASVPDPMATPQAKIVVDLKACQPRKPSACAKARKWLQLKLFQGTFDYWATCALGEDDANLKLAYFTKTLRLNPAYAPAWGLKGKLLLELQRYAEALECFCKSSELRPSAFMDFQKGLCCFHLHRCDEALKLFDSAQSACSKEDRLLLEEISRMKSLASSPGGT